MLVNVILIASILNPYFSLAFPADEVTHLPGLAKQPTFRHYSGYLNATKGRYYHYWFVESQSNPQKDPVILWLTGGPGCSSLSALFTENGPFRVDSTGIKVTEDPNSWNSIANVLYLESPVGVGYSYSDNKNNTNSTDDSTAEDNYLSLQSFFKKFPQFSRNEFYITGESYAGVYIPMLAIKIFENKSTINLKGVAIGNGALDKKYYGFNAADSARMLYTHGLMGSEDYHKVMDKHCRCDSRTGQQVCDFEHGKNNRAYGAFETKAEKIKYFNLNPYNILNDCNPLGLYSTDKRFSNSRLYTDLNTYYGIDWDDMQDMDQYYSSKPVCDESAYNVYLNDTTVRKALHIPEHVQQWYLCSFPPYRQQYKSMRTQFKQLVEKYKIQSFIVYYGDSDTVCDFLGGQQFVEELGYKLNASKIWSANGRVAGLVKRYEGINFITVRNAGHMSPGDQPIPVLQIVKELIGVSKLNYFGDFI